MTEAFDQTIDDFYTLYMKSREQARNSNVYYQQTQQYLSKYTHILNEPEMKSIIENFDKLKSKYNFKCELLLDELYDNQKYVLSESHQLGPYIVEPTNHQYSFLADKPYNCLDDIKREMFKHQIKILSNNNPDNFSYINNAMLVIRCPHCNCFGRNQATKPEYGKPYDNTIDFNSFMIGVNYTYECINCKKPLISRDTLEFFYKLNDTRVCDKMMKITSSSGGRYSIINTEAKIKKPLNSQ
jgi:hypothetical protein